MLFNSFEFLVFFPIVAAVYFMLPHKFRWVHLLFSSCVFYAAFIPVYLLILFLVIVIDYWAGLMIEKEQGYRRRWLLAISILANVGILAFFKYYNFFAGNLNFIFPHIPYLNIILPIGLSFHTFQAMSYAIEVYRGNQKAEKHLGKYALYVMFFPQLVAGPIERPQHLLPQFHEKKSFNYYNVTSGLKLMLWGYFRKVVIADRLAPFTATAFNDPHHQTSLSLLVAVFFFSFQIFCDFSGYSDIAIGCARVLSFELVQNFRNPYVSRSIPEFWKRWHISLSSWFRDYLYISLGGNRVSVPRWYFNILIVFLVSGLWHGANWTFVAWGALHGFYFLFGNATRSVRERLARLIKIDRIQWLYRFLQIVTTFALVSFAWIFFRANNITDALFIARKIVSPGSILSSLKQGLSFPGFDTRQLFLSFLLIVFLQLVLFFRYRYNLTNMIARQPIAVRWMVYYLLILAILFLNGGATREFIYFQF